MELSQAQVTQPPVSQTRRRASSRASIARRRSQTAFDFDGTFLRMPSKL